MTESLLLLIMLASAGPGAIAPCPPTLSALDDQDKKIDKRPEVKELVGQLGDHVKERGKQDQEAIELLQRLVTEFPNSGPKDRGSIVKGVAKCFDQKRPQTEEGVPNNKLYIAAAVSLGEMGPDSAKALAGWIEHKRVRGDVDVQRALILALGKTRSEKEVKKLLDLLDNYKPMVQGAAAEALANYAGVDLKLRKDIFKEVLQALTGVKNQVDADVTLQNTIARERYDVIRGPMVTALQELSGHEERDPSAWQRWWNKNKKKDWDEEA